MTSLQTLVDHLAPSVLTLTVPLTDEESARHVGGVVLYDAAALEAVEPAGLVLGAGLAHDADVVEGLRRLAPRRPAVLVARAGACRSQDVLDAAGRAGVVLLAVDGPPDWIHLALLIRELLDGGRPSDEGGGLSTDDLFRVANAIEALVDAPVTIEDPHSRILAFSEGQERADEARRATILGRKAPNEYYARMKQHGVFRRLHSSPGAMFVPGRSPNIKPRVVQPVRASGEFLGSIWLVVEEPLDEHRERALALAAHTVALHLLRQRLQADSWRVTEAATVATLLQGGAGAVEVASRLGMKAPAYQVVAFAARSAPTLDSEAMLLRLWDGLRISLSAVNRASASAKIDGTIFAIVPLATANHVGEPDPAVRKAIHDFLHHHGPVRDSLVVGLGSAVDSIVDLARSRDQAVRTISVLRQLEPKQTLADIVEVGPSALALHLIEAMEADPSLGAAGLRRLQDYDTAKNTQFVATVTAWLDAFGDTDATAAQLGVHPNTVRYRIRQLRDLNLVDLDDPSGRLALIVHMLRGQFGTAVD